MKKIIKLKNLIKEQISTQDSVIGNFGVDAGNISVVYVIYFLMGEIFK